MEFCSYSYNHFLLEKPNTHVTDFFDLGGGFTPKTEHVFDFASTKCYICHKPYVPECTHAF